MSGLNVQLLPFSEWLVRTTVQGTVVICLILLVKAVLRDKLPIRWHYWLWLLLLVRIFLPWAPSSKLSIFNFIPASLEVGRLVPIDTRTGFLRLVNILPYVWLIGALILAGFALLRSFRLWRTVKRERPITNEKILDLLEDCKMEMGIQTLVGVVVSDRVKSPALFGFIRPRLLLPEGMIERHELEELRYIFIHELGHLKQRDIYLSWLMTLFQVVYWFNPLMWFAIRRIRLEREFACDGLALSTLSADEPPRYGHTIVNLLEKFSQVSYVPSVAGIVEDTSQIERRIKMIAKFKKTSRTRSVAAALLVAILACVALTDAYPAELPFTFGTPENLGPPVNSPLSEGAFCISPDGLELYFGSDRPGGYGRYDIWVTTRQTIQEPWAEPVNLGPQINTSLDDGVPTLSADGLTL
ncbi:MAG: M56 family metallopeptidase, partial [Planctomycetota bacterium]